VRRLGRSRRVEPNLGRIAHVDTDTKPTSDDGARTDPYAVANISTSDNASPGSRAGPGAGSRR
jgi:hypothetical protein